MTLICRSSCKCGGHTMYLGKQIWRCMDCGREQKMLPITKCDFIDDGVFFVWQEEAL